MVSQLIGAYEAADAGGVGAGVQVPADTLESMAEASCCAVSQQGRGTLVSGCVLWSCGGFVSPGACAVVRAAGAADPRRES